MSAATESHPRPAPQAQAHPARAAVAECLPLVSIRCFNSLEEASFLRDEVDALNRRSARPDPFSTFEFFRAFVQHDEFFPQGRGLQLWFLAAFQDDKLIGYLALKQVDHKVWGLPSSTLSLLVTHDTDRPHVVSAPEHLPRVTQAFYNYVLSRKAEWNYLEFQQQDSSSSLFPPPASVDLSGYRVRQWPSLENCSISIRWGGLGEYFGALGKKYRTNLARQMRNLLASGRVELLASSDPATLPALFELYRSIEAHSWKSQANASIGRHPQRVAYFKALLDAQQPMRVSIHVLMLNGIPIAGLISGAFEKTLYALHIVYDERVGRLAPGSAMLLLGMRQAIAAGCTCFNLLSGFGYYKTRWLAQTTETRIAQIYRAGSPMYWNRVLGDCKRWLLSGKAHAAKLHFNPARRGVVERPAEDSPSSGNAPLSVSHGDRARIDALVAQVRAGQGEFLSSDALAAVMPVEVQRAPVLRPPR